MLNPEVGRPFIRETNGTFEFVVPNPKSYQLSELEVLVKDHISLIDRDVLTVIDGEKIPLLNNELREVLRRTISFGASEEAFIKNAALDIHKADSFIVRENYSLFASKN